MSSLPKRDRASFAYSKLAVFLIAFFTAVAAYVTHQFVIMQSFRELEREETLKNIARVSSCVQLELDGLSKLATDYSNWDEMYDFAGSGSKEFIEQNLDMSYFVKTFGLTAVEVRDSRGDPLWLGAAPEDGSERAPSLDDIAGARVLPALHRKTMASAKAVSGLLHHDGDVYFLSVSGVVPASHRAAANGAVYFAKKLSPDYLANLVRNIRVDFAVKASTPDSYDPLPKTMVADDDTIIATQGATDILGVPVLAFEARMGREIYRHGRQVADVVAFAIALIGGLVVIITVIGVRSASSLNNSMTMLERAVFEKEKEILMREKAEEALEHTLSELRESLANVKTLEGILPICCVCKKIRDDKGYWNQVEAYMTMHTDAMFTHGICPDCAKEHYQYDPKKDKDKDS